jgi:hypothetical protein
MIDIVLLVLGAIAALGPAATIAVIAVALLTIALVVDWFRDRAAQVTTDPDKVAVTVAEAIDSGNVSYIQGIFDTDKGAFTEARRIKAKSVDPGVQRAHARHQVAIWE